MSDRQSTPVTDFEDDPEIYEDTTPVNHYVVLLSRQDTAFYSDKTLDQIISNEGHRQLICGLAQMRERKLPAGTEARTMDSLIGEAESGEIWDFVNQTQWEAIEKAEKGVYTEISWNGLVSAAKVSVPDGRDEQANEASARSVESKQLGDDSGVTTEPLEETSRTAENITPLATNPEVSVLPDVADSALCECQVTEDGP